MKKELKKEIVQDLTEKFRDNRNFYIANISSLNVGEITEFRKRARKSGIEIRMVKNTLVRKALENANIELHQFEPVLHGSSTLIFAEDVKAPAKLIREFRGKKALPSLKAAFIEESLYVGDDQIEVLEKLKSKNDLIADVIFMLQSPMMKVIGGLQGSGHKIAGLVKTLSEKED
jgi:large subunit ribosomal protein L10